MTMITDLLDALSTEYPSVRAFIRIVTTEVLDYLDERRLSSSRSPRLYCQLPLGFQLADVLPDVVVNVTAKPQLDVQGGRLLIPSEFASSFVLLQISVNGVPQLGGATGDVPCQTFQENAPTIDMPLDRCNKGQEITLTIKNVSRLSRLFAATMVLRVVDQA